MLIPCAANSENSDIFATHICPLGRKRNPTLSGFIYVARNLSSHRLKVRKFESHFGLKALAWIVNSDCEGDHDHRNG